MNVDRKFSMIGIGLIVLNWLAHVLNLKDLIHPFGYPANLTFFTSLSLLSLLVGFSFSKSHSKSLLYSFALVVQLVSLGLYFFDLKSSIEYFYYSSWPSSTFIISAAVLLLMVEKNHPIKIIKPFAGPILLLLALGFFLAFVLKKLFLLGLSDQRIGIGLSPYTLLNFLLIASLVAKKHTRHIKLKPLGISYSPKRALIVAATFALLNVLLFCCPSERLLFFAIALQSLFLVVSYFIFFHPFVKNNQSPLTICAWSKKIRLHNGEWKNLDEYLKTMGVELTHGISPAEKLKMELKRATRNKN